jgi:hypothetical protein
MIDARLLRAIAEPEMDIQRLRNLTTGKLHTEITHVYQDIEYLTGVKRVMTHMLPRANRALKPYLRAKVKDARFWDGAYDTSHMGAVEVPPMSAVEQSAFRVRYEAQPDPLAGRDDVAVALVSLGSGA